MSTRDESPLIASINAAMRSPKVDERMRQQWELVRSMPNRLPPFEEVAFLATGSGPKPEIGGVHINQVGSIYTIRTTYALVPVIVDYPGFDRLEASVPMYLDQS